MDAHVPVRLAGNYSAELEGAVFFSFFEEAKSTVVLPLFGGDGEKMNWMMSSYRYRFSQLDSLQRNGAVWFWYEGVERSSCCDRVERGANFFGSF